MHLMCRLLSHISSFRTDKYAHRFGNLYIVYSMNKASASTSEYRFCIPAVDSDFGVEAASLKTTLLQCECEVCIPYNHGSISTAVVFCYILCVEGSIPRLPPRHPLC